MGRHSLISQRPYVYIVGVCVLSAATVIFFVGFVSPFWHLQKIGGLTFVHGLWLVCLEESVGLAQCEETVFGTAAWLRWIQTLQVLAMLFLIAACILSILFNYARKITNSKLLEVCSSFGATFAILGSLGYLFLSMSPREDTDNVLTYSWAFAMSIAGSLLAVIAAFLIGISNCLAPPGWERFQREDDSASSPSPVPAPVLWRGRMNALQQYRPRNTMLAIEGPPAKGSLGDPLRVDMFRNPNMWLLPAHLHWVSNV